MGKDRWTLRKWNFIFGIIPDYQRRNGYIFVIGIFNLISFPAEGMMFGRENYKGFWIKKYFRYDGFEISF